MPISEQWVQTNGQLHKVHTTFNKSLGQTLPSAWKCLKTQFWGPLTNWKFEPSPRPTHTLTPSAINTQNRSKTTYGFVMVCTDLPATGQISLTHWKARIWLSWPSKKNSRHTHQNQPTQRVKPHWFLDIGHTLPGMPRLANTDEGHFLLSPAL